MTRLIRGIKKTGMFLILGFCIQAANAGIEHDGDWFSENTLASVVKLSSIVEIYEVEGLPSNYSYRTRGGKPDFGNASVLSRKEDIWSVGTGVIISETGTIISNAHVTRAHIKPEIAR